MKNHKFTVYLLKSQADCIMAYWSVQDNEAIYPGVNIVIEQTTHANLRLLTFTAPKSKSLNCFQSDVFDLIWYSGKREARSEVK